MKLKTITSLVLKQHSLNTLLMGGLLLGGTIIPQPQPSYAQRKIDPSVIEEIRQAPFSTLFKIQSGDSIAYAVKDKDFKAKQSSIGLFTLWGEVPGQQRLEAYALYCLPSEKFAVSGNHLLEMVLLDDNKELVRINKILGTSASQSREIEPSQYIPMSFTDNPFSAPFWSPFGPSIGYVAPTYIPPVQCSAGGTRFDLKPVKEQIANLPNKTLTIKLIFNNGATDTWKLGGGTVKAMKELPIFQKSPGT